MDKKFTDKLKEGISVEEIESFTRKHTTEVFTLLAIAIGAISSSFHFFTGPGLTIFAAAVGMIGAVLFPTHVDKILKRYYLFCQKQEKSTQMVLGAVKIVLGLFIPFVLYAGLGLLAGSSYHYYARQGQASAEPRSTPSKTDHA